MIVVWKGEDGKAVISPKVVERASKDFLNSFPRVRVKRIKFKGRILKVWVELSLKVETSEEISNFSKALIDSLKSFLKDSLGIESFQIELEIVRVRILKK